MPPTQALLMDIHYPDGSDSLYLTTGRGFEMLREDKSGREIYGLRHNDREYLFFPFSFKPVDAGVLAMQMPQEYEECCLDQRAHGARIVFGAVHGSPFFPDMPDEYKSNAGVISVDSSGSLRVLLDKVEPGTPFGSCGCGCGDQAGHGRGEKAAARSHGSERRHPPFGTRGSCGCAGANTSDEDLAAVIRLAAEKLNAALRRGYEAGLCISVSAGADTMADNDETTCPSVLISRIARPL